MITTAHKVNEPTPAQRVAACRGTSLNVAKCRAMPRLPETIAIAGVTSEPSDGARPRPTWAMSRPAWRATPASASDRTGYCNFHSDGADTFVSNPTSEGHTIAQKGITMKITLTILIGLSAAWPSGLRADDAQDAPLPVPLTRLELKQALEDLKDRPLRIPLPELTEQDRAKLGERAESYEARLRYHYMPSGAGQGGFFFSREPDPNMSLDYAFKTMLFWIVSRTNNCHY